LSNFCSFLFIFKKRETVFFLSSKQTRCKVILGYAIKKVKHFYNNWTQLGCESKNVSINLCGLDFKRLLFSFAQLFKGRLLKMLTTFINGLKIFFNINVLYYYFLTKEQNIVYNWSLIKQWKEYISFLFLISKCWQTYFFRQLYFSLLFFCPQIFQDQYVEK
jgi:hypothetical protein